MRWISFSLVQSQRGKLGFGLSYHWHSKLCWECPHVSRNTKCGKCLLRVVEPRLCTPTSPGQAQVRSSVRGRNAAVTCGTGGGEEQASQAQSYCVVTSFTIMLMIREPLGHVHRSMLGFLILSWRSWSSSQRSSFTSSAIYNKSCSISCAGSKGEGFHRETPIMITMV